MNTLCEAQASIQGFYDPIASYLEGFYRDNSQHYGKVDFNAYLLLEVKGGKSVLIIPIFCNALFQTWTLAMMVYLLAGLELIQWLHWLYDYT